MRAASPGPWRLARAQFDEPGPEFVQPELARKKVFDDRLLSDFQIRIRIRI